MSKVLLATSDLHTGSYWGIMPERVLEQIGTDEKVHRPTKGQRWLLEEFLKMKEEIGRIDAVLVNGDSCEGPNYKELGLANWTNNLTVQANAAADVLRLLKPKRFFVTEGSGYHVGHNLTLDGYVAQLLGGEYGPDLAIVADGEDYRIHACHWVRVSSAAYYRSTPLAKELLAARLNEKEYGQFNGLIRSHAHYFVYLEYGSQWGVIIPGFKGRDAYLAKKGLEFTPKVGYYAVEIEKGEVVNRWKGVLDLKKMVKEVVF